MRAPSRRRIPALGLALLGIVAAAPRAAAQTPAGTEAVSAVPPGEIVRVRLRGGGAWEGDFVGTRGGRILLAGGRDTLSLAPDDVTALWVRERRTRRGARTGALVGGGVGLAVSGFFAALLAGIGGEGSGDDAVGLVVGGTALGAAGGAVLGGTVGAAASGWRQVVPADPDIRPAVPRVVARVGEPGASSEAGPAAVPTRRRFGSLDGAVSYGRLSGAGGSEGSAGGRLALLTELRYDGEDGGTRRLVAFGPEAELQGVGPATVVEPVFRDCGGTPGCQSVVDDTVRRAFTAGALRGVVRVGPETDRWRAYGLLGAGVHGWRTETSYGGSWYVHPAGVAGAGVQLRPGAGPLFVGVEGRMNRVVLSGDDYPPGYWTAALTVNTSL